MHAHDARRRHLVLGAAFGAGALLVPWRGASAAPPTPPMTVGPFYPDPIPLERDADLVRVGDGEPSARGEYVDLSGRVLDERGRALADVRVEIWQCDANGRYHHAGDTSGAPLDEGFQGYGAVTTNADGAYRFRTIRPVPYPGRTPHIHFALSGDGFERLATQMFVAGEPGNANDRLYRRIPEGVLRESVTIELVRIARPDARYAARFDVVLAADGRFG
jgi:protocatechuate 3,4-dioxygenase beta subunit